MREAYFTIIRDDPDEVINPRDFAQDVAAARLHYIPVAAAENPTPPEPITATESSLSQQPIAVVGDRRKRDDDEEQIDKKDDFFMDSDGAIVRRKRDAQVNTLQQEFGSQLPQSFLRPKYKFFHSPLFPEGLKKQPPTLYWL